MYFAQTFANGNKHTSSILVLSRAAGDLLISDFLCFERR